MSVVLMETNLPHLCRRGKVRDIYDLGDTLLIVSTDRISAFDVVLPTGIPDKGAVLTQLSAFWFEKTAPLVPNHFLKLIISPQDLSDSLKLLGLKKLPEELVGRSMLIRKAQPLPVECVVRGYLAGSGWVEYQAAGQICGIPLPRGLRESDRLPEPIFTPTTKAETGHDLPLTFQQAADMVGMEVATILRDWTLTLYRFGIEYALGRGIIIADTKFEFGLTEDGIILIDEMLTPDSSRFWAVDTYVPGGPQPSFDKQYVRDWLTAIGWNREPPAPDLPPEVVEKTAEKYREAYLRLTGKSLKRYG